MKLGLVQAVSTAEVWANLETICQYVRRAGEEGCGAVCFPECFLTGYAPEQADERGLSRHSRPVRQLAELAAEYGVDILAGFMERDGPLRYITHGLFCHDGRECYYRKTHLGQREGTFFAPGEELEVFSLSDGTRAGIMLCVETHYPRIAETLALKGAQVIFAPHAVPRAAGDRQKIWDKYIRARSYDNRVYVACCNLWDADRFGGGCLVTDPRGETAAACFAEEPRLLVCRVEPELSADFRDMEKGCSRHWYPPKGRRELYL